MERKKEMAREYGEGMKERLKWRKGEKDTRDLFIHLPAKHQAKHQSPE